MNRAHNLPLVHALVGVAWAHDEAQLQTENPKVIERLRHASNEVHECAMAIERDLPLTERQSRLIEELNSEK